VSFKGNLKIIRPFKTRISGKKGVKEGLRPSKEILFPLPLSKGKGD